MHPVLNIFPRFARSACVLLLAWPACVPASVAPVPQYGEVDSGLHVTLITSLHTSGPEVSDEEGMPKGWPAAAQPGSVPLFVSGANGDFLYVPVQRGGVLRVAPVPSQYQVDIPYPLYKYGTNSDPERHRSDVLGNLVRRDNGDLVGALYATETDVLQGGALYRMDFDGTHGALIASTVGKVNRPMGPLVADGDMVYGVDFGPQGQGRIFRLDGDDVFSIVHEFAPASDGRPQIPNGFTLGADGALYGVTAYDRGVWFEPETPRTPDTPTGTIYRLHPDQADSFTVLRTLTLAEGEIVTISPGARPLGGSRSPSALNWVVEGPEGWLYGTVAIGQCATPSEGTVGTQLRSNPLCGMKKDSEHWQDTEFPHYDATDTVFGAVYRIRLDGSDFQILHRFDYDDGASPRGPLAVGADGAIYGTTLSGGQHESVTFPNVPVMEAWTRGRWVPESLGLPPHPDNCRLYDGVCRSEWHSRDGVLYRIVPEKIDIDEQGAVVDGGFELLHHFRRAESGKTPLGIVRGGDGRLYGATGYGGGPWISKVGVEHQADIYGTIFMVGAASESAVTLTVAPAEVVPGTRVELTWTSHQARDCVATSSSGDWTGAQPTQGSVDIVHDVSGSYTYALTCIDETSGAQITSGVQTLRVSRPATETDGNTVRYGNGGAMPGLLLLAFGGLLGLRRRLSSHP